MVSDDFSRFSAFGPSGVGAVECADSLGSMWLNCREPSHERKDSISMVSLLQDAHLHLPLNILPTVSVIPPLCTLPPVAHSHSRAGTRFRLPSTSC